MSYQVLARKWRPANFEELAGQQHVMQALSNALDQKRLHHAYLFTGTRGVGKTTIARILAKCLNCEQGVSSKPCGQCGACVAISESRFIDLIEVDAASRTKVEDTRELLENVQYVPTQGRYKVYLIDEVHMLSMHSFNALLKTLEEPPPHVKFILATTDPQKLPVTILSRCLQFNLKNMEPELIASRLQHILTEENIPFEERALRLLGRAAKGSMRDALSLTDQAVGFSGGDLNTERVEAMLGTFDINFVFSVIDGLIAQDGAAILDVVARVAELSVDYASLLEEIILGFHHIAMAQAVPDAVENFDDGERWQAYAAKLTAEETQLYYQLGINARRDLPLSPDMRTGLEMALLRMLSFCPARETDFANRAEAAAPVSAVTEDSPVVAENAAALEKKKKLAADSPLVEPDSGRAELSSVATTVAAPDNSLAAATLEETAIVEPRAAVKTKANAETEEKETEAKKAAKTADSVERINEKPVDGVAVEADSLDHDCWVQYFDDFGLSGLLKSVASHCVLESQQQDTLHMVLDQDNASIYNDSYQEKIAALLSEYFQQTYSVRIRIAAVDKETPFAYRQRRQQERLSAAEAEIDNDENIHLLKQEFGAVIQKGSISPVD